MSLNNGCNNVVELEPINNIELYEEETVYTQFSQTAKRKLEELQKIAVNLLGSDSQQKIQAYITPTGDNGYEAVIRYVDLDFPNGNRKPNAKVTTITISEDYLS